MMDWGASLGVAERDLVSVDWVPHLRDVTPSLWIWIELTKSSFLEVEAF